MRSHIDWLTFTLTPRWMEQTADDHYSAQLANALFYDLGADVAGGVFAGEWEKLEHGRAPYKDAWTIAASGITIFATEGLHHFCVEISGAGCERLLEIQAMRGLLEKVRERVTRIDIACDIETATRPPDFVAVVNKKRMRSSGYQKSAQGETCYVGSKTSDRYARVYRYEEPHPRAALLRVEHVFRREQAKTIAAGICEHGVDECARAAGEVFGWAHQNWQPDLRGDFVAPSVSAERKGGGSVFWMVNQVAPAFKRLVETGVIKDPDDFIAKYFLS